MATTTPPGVNFGEELVAHSKDATMQERIDSDRIPTPPTSEDLNKHDEGHSSGLSDLEEGAGEMDAEEELDIKPDHYWDEENGGRIPVFKPVCKNECAAQPNTKC